MIFSIRVIFFIYIFYEKSLSTCKYDNIKHKYHYFNNRKYDLWQKYTLKKSNLMLLRFYTRISCTTNYKALHLLFVFLNIFNMPILRFTPKHFPKNVFKHTVLYPWFFCLLLWRSYDPIGQSQEYKMMKNL